jgi:hypothetical protein
MMTGGDLTLPRIPHQISIEAAYPGISIAFRAVPRNLVRDGDQRCSIRIQYHFYNAD